MQINMRKWSFLLAALAFALTGCAPLPSISVTAIAPALPTPPASATPTMTSAPLLPTPTATIAPSPGPALALQQLRVYPMPLVAGDRATLDIAPLLPPGVSLPLTVTVVLPRGPALTLPVVPEGLDGRPRARFYWAWDTAGLLGPQYLTVTLAVSPEVTVTGATTVVWPVTVAAPSTLLPPEPGATWATAAAAGFRLHYLTGSAAARDLAYLIAEAEAAYADVTEQLGAEISAPVEIYIMDRVVGQGGYASSGWVAISYTDRMYAPAHLPLLLRHELTHRLDDALGCRTAPTLIREGLAVTLAGGHYWPESLPRKAAALLAVGQALPLGTLVQDFYASQHEIGYLEAGAIVTYIIEEADWNGLARFCHAAAATKGDGRAQFEAGLAELGWGSLADFEAAWLRWLRVLQSTPREQAALAAEWHLMESLRAYQARYDPAAHFLSGVLFSPLEGEAQGITADFVRRPRSAEAIALELLLITAQELVFTDPAGAEVLLDEVDAALADAALADAALAGGFSATGTLADVLALARACLAQGYEPYRLACAETGSVQARQPDCLVHSLERGVWPTRRLLWATRLSEHADAPPAWALAGPQAEP